MSITFYFCPWCGVLINGMTSYAPGDDPVEMLVFEMVFFLERMDANPDFPREELLNDHLRFCQAEVGAVLAGVTVEPERLW